MGPMVGNSDSEQLGHEFAGWLRAVSVPNARRSLLLDVAAVMVFCGGHIVAAAVAPDPSGRTVWWPLAVSIPATCGLLVRRRFPWLVLVTCVAAEYVLLALQVDAGLMYLVILMALYSVCVQASRVGVVVGGLLAMAYMTLQFYIPILEVSEVASVTVGIIMVIGWAQAMKVARQRAMQLERTVSLLGEARDQMAADAAVVERARIAREFHDIVSHNLSVVALRAGVARALVDENREHARETLLELERTSRSALEEMRYSLGALRTDEAGGFGSAPGEREEAARQPAPGLDRVDSLLEAVRGAGVEWSLERRGSVRSLTSGLEVTAYRVVQEAVTNILKHACSGRAAVLLDYGTRMLRVEITNYVAQPGNSRSVKKGKPNEQTEPRVALLPPSGHGLIGLRERVALLGGTLAAHPVPGGFHVAAVLPCPEASEAA